MHGRLMVQETFFAQNLWKYKWPCYVNNLVFKANLVLATHLARATVKARLLRKLLFYLPLLSGTSRTLLINTLNIQYPNVIKLPTTLVVGFSHSNHRKLSELNTWTEWIRINSLRFQAKFGSGLEHRSSHRKFSGKKGVRKNFGNFSEKHLCRSLQACSFINKRLQQVFSCEIWENAARFLKCDHFGTLCIKGLSLWDAK